MGRSVTDSKRVGGATNGRSHKSIHKKGGVLKRKLLPTDSTKKQKGVGTTKERRGTTKEGRGTTKERRGYRKQQKTNFELVRESKVIWEHLRQRKNLPGQTLALDEIIALAQGHFKELSLKHDTARVVQSCLKYGTTQHRTIVFSELRDHIVELCKMRYSKFVVKSLLKYCTSAERSHVISSLYGNVRKLIRHCEASDVVELVYNEYANGRQRTALAQEFYGTEFALFKDTPMVDGCGLKEVLLSHPSQKIGILAHMRDSLLPLIEKSVIRHSILHKAILDYLIYCSPEARAEMIENLRDVVVHILHTKDGSRVAIYCIWHGTPKDRKVIVKSFKSLTAKICKEENGHIVIMSILDCVDDTVLIKKAILPEIQEHLMELSGDQFGRRVLLYLLCPRSPRHFSPQFIAILSPGDGNLHSKKPSDLRRRELLDAMTDTFLDIASSHALEWARSKRHAPMLLEIANSLSGDLSPLYQPLLDAVCRDDITSERCGGDIGEECGLLTHDSGHWVIKRLIEIDYERKDRDGIGFINAFLSCVNAEMIRCLVSKSNRGAFVVCALLKVGGEGAREICKILRPLNKLLATSTSKGQEAILACLEQLNHHS